MVNITTANLFALATSAPYAAQISSLSNTQNKTVNFLATNDTFTKDILGPDPTVELLATEPYQAFHEAGVYYAATNASYISSNILGLSHPTNTSIYNYTSNSVSSARYPGLAAANGGTLFIAPNDSSPTTNKLVPGKHYLLFTDEGTLTSPSQLIAVDPVANTSVPLVTSFFGRAFASLNDVKQHPRTGDVYFTDAAYGYFQNFRPVPTMPLQVYRYSPSTGVLRVIADNFVQPNGIELSPDLRTLYVTDSGASEFTFNTTRPATIYKYDLNHDGTELGPRRVFAYMDVGVPDGIHTDTHGNVYSGSGAGDGVQVWNKEGTLLGKFLVEGGINNFEFIKGGMLLFNADRLWRVGIKAIGREVAREYGLH